MEHNLFGTVTYDNPYRDRTKAFNNWLVSNYVCHNGIAVNKISMPNFVQYKTEFLSTFVHYFGGTPVDIGNVVSLKRAMVTHIVPYNVPRKVYGYTLKSDTLIGLDCADEGEYDLCLQTQIEFLSELLTKTDEKNTQEEPRPIGKSLKDKLYDWHVKRNTAHLPSVRQEIDTTPSGYIFFMLNRGYFYIKKERLIDPKLRRRIFLHRIEKYGVDDHKVVFNCLYEDYVRDVILFGSFTIIDSWSRIWANYTVEHDTVFNRTKPYLYPLINTHNNLGLSMDCIKYVQSNMIKRIEKPIRRDMARLDERKIFRFKCIDDTCGVPNVHVFSRCYCHLQKTPPPNPQEEYRTRYIEYIEDVINNADISVLAKSSASGRDPLLEADIVAFVSEMNQLMKETLEHKFPYYLYFIGDKIEARYKGKPIPPYYYASCFITI